MTITKEKNIISIEVEPNKAYKIDINTGVIYGLSGSALKALPSKLGRELKAIRRNNTDVQALWVFADDHWWTYSGVYARTITPSWLTHMQMLDKFQAIGYPMTECKNIFNIYENEFNKYFAKFAKAYMADNSLTFTGFIEKHKEEMFLSEINIDMNMPYMNERIVRTLKDWWNEGIFTKKQFKYIIKYLTIGQIYNCATVAKNMSGLYTIKKQFKEYFDNCDFFNIEYTKEDFYKHYGFVALIAHERQNEILNARINARQTAKKDILSFENDLYKIIIPTTVEELIQEGEDNSNCVGGYGSYIAEGSKYVVFVRSKANLGKSLVTVDISATSGAIRQYYAFGNRSVYYGENPDLYTFKNEYQEHLKKNWGKA